MTDKEIISEAPRELSESIKLTKNSKGYGWEIRILNLDVDKIQNLNLKMMERFGDDKDVNINTR